MDGSISRKNKNTSVPLCFFFYTCTSHHQSTLTSLTDCLQFLITTNCTLSIRTSNPKGSCRMHWISPAESVFCLAALTATKLLALFFFSPLARETR
jgi:hypothetical protein